MQKNSDTGNIDSASAGPSAVESGGRFFRKLDWSAFWTATFVSFLVYLYTLAPTVTLEDSGELAVAGDYLGVPHPPGYPIWTMLAWLFARAFEFVKFRGQPNPAWSIGLMSAVFGALAAGMTSMLICRSGTDMLRGAKKISEKVDKASEDLICWVGGVVCSLLFAFSPVMWSQSVINEVYSLNAFFLVLIFLLTYKWMCRPTDHLLYVTAFIFGLGLTNYQVLLLAALPLVFAIFLRDTKLFRDFIITVVPFLLVIGLIKAGHLPQIKHPTHPSCFTYVFLNFLALGLSYFFLPRGKAVALTILCAELGVAFYVYMPIVSDLRNPPMNWGYPRTWQGFKHAITRGQYEKIKPSDMFSLRFIHQIGAYLTDLRAQFTLPMALTGFLPFTMWQLGAGKRKINALYVAVSLSLAACFFAFVVKAVPGQPQALVTLYKALIAGVIAILLAGGAAIVVSLGTELTDKLLGKVKVSLSERLAVGVVVAGVLIAFLGYTIQLARKIGVVTAPVRTAQGIVESEQVREAILGTMGILALIIGPVALIATIWGLMRSKRFEFRVMVNINSQKWIFATLLGFLTMSILLIALANPKGDIQDYFIQRVKFISSHALYAFWIGYGLIFGLAFLEVLFKGNSLVKWSSLAVAIVIPLIPIHENYYNPELIRVSGGADQNGRDFGWQFGNYQLRGADAITEELSPTEEPLPNPEFPPEMGKNAVFFGGTDPGRFVPTYMIYSARVREDVYLITQNALADNTYMSVMRDLYGDQIWIPSETDSGRAFQVYVEEVRSGKRPRNASLVIENGRVQVSGALGVMEINGILARMIFDRNKYRHPFYVEESYVLQWMYPFLTPHGLIMKINNEETDLSEEVIRDDVDFWDWYTRRLLSDRKFVRDVVARKSFSKLRSAIGGLYAFHNRLAVAEKAFREARALYPLSPEANFRLAQDVLFRQGRFAEVRGLMMDFHRRDPGHGRALDLVDRIDQINEARDEIQRLERTMRSDQMDVNQVIRLIQLYKETGQIQKFQAVASSLAAQSNLPAIAQMQLAKLYEEAGMYGEMTKMLDMSIDRIPAQAPPNVFLDIAKAYSKAKRPERVADSLERYLKLVPGDWKAWLDLSILKLQLQQTNSAARALQNAAAAGGPQAVSAINQNPYLEPLRRRQLTPRNSLMNLPGLGQPDRSRLPRMPRR